MLLPRVSQPLGRLSEVSLDEVTHIAYSELFRVSRMKTYLTLMPDILFAETHVIQLSACLHRTRCGCNLIDGGKCASRSTPV